MTRMKESGIDWIGQIPEEWEVTKLKYALLISNGKDYKDIEVEEGGYPVIGSGGVFARSRNYMYDGDVVLLGRKGTIDKPLFYSGKFWTVDTMFYSTALNGNNIKFMYYSSLLIPFSYYSTATALPSMTQSDLNNHVLCLPSISEQQKIADFLDKKTVQLDKVKALLEEQIQKLKDYRASLIYETVTKGLDKTVPMKDSGIDWIGQVPEGWEVGKIKYFSQISAGATPDRNNSLFWNGNINWMSSGEINQGIVKHTSETITDLALKRTSTKLLPNGTVMLALNGQGKTKGTAAVLAIESASNQSLASFIVDNKILNNMYLYYFFVANYYNIRGLKGEDRDGLNLQLVSNIVIPLFEIEKQQKIVDFLDKKTVQIEQLIQIKNKQIDNINKKRQTLIYDYVTGKRRV